MFPQTPERLAEVAHVHHPIGNASPGAAWLTATAARAAAIRQLLAKRHNGETLRPYAPTTPSRTPTSTPARWQPISGCRCVIEPRRQASDSQPRWRWSEWPDACSTSSLPISPEERDLRLSTCRAVAGGLSEPCVRFTPRVGRGTPRPHPQGMKGRLASDDSDEGARTWQCRYRLNRCAPRAALASTDAATMRVPRFWHFGRPVPPSDPDDGLDRSRAWRDSGLADEVQAFFAGRLVNHLAAYRQPVPAWAALNRLAHADRSDLLRVLEGANTDSTAPSSAHAAWAAAERFAAGHLLARAHTPEELRHVQRATLVPLELVLIEQTKIERLTADQVLGCRGGGQLPLRAAERPRQHRLAPRRRPGPRPGTGGAGQAWPK